MAPPPNYTVNTDIWFKHSFPDAGVQTRDESGFGQNHKSGFCLFHFGLLVDITRIALETYHSQTRAISCQNPGKLGQKPEMLKNPKKKFVPNPDLYLPASRNSFCVINRDGIFSRLVYLT
jgi:hypothetical protein